MAVNSCKHSPSVGASQLHFKVRSCNQSPTTSAKGNTDAHKYPYTIFYGSVSFHSQNKCTVCTTPQFEHCICCILDKYMWFDDVKHDDVVLSKMLMTT